MNATDWAALGFGIPIVAVIVTGLVLDFRGHAANIRQALRNPDDYDGPGFARVVAERLRARQAEETTGPSLNQETQAMPPLVPTGTVRFWRDNRELVAVEGFAWDDFAPLVVCRDPDALRFWCIIHRPTGRPLPTVYYDAEDALMAVNRLERVCDWASPEAAIERERLMKLPFTSPSSPTSVPSPVALPWKGPFPATRPVVWRRTGTDECVIHSVRARAQRAPAEVVRPMGFSEEDNLKLKPVNADRGWVGILRNWKGILKPKLRAPAGVLDWEAQSAAETFTDLLGQEAGEDDTDDRKLWLATGSGWNCWKRAALSRTSRRNGNRKPRPSTQLLSSIRGRASDRLHRKVRATRYRLYGHVAQSSATCAPRSFSTIRNGSTLCPVMPEWPGEWLGTGGQAEYEKAASLPLCKACAKAAGGEDEYYAEPSQFTDPMKAAQ